MAHRFLYQFYLDKDGISCLLPSNCHNVHSDVAFGLEKYSNPIHADPLKRKKSDFVFVFFLVVYLNQTCACVEMHGF